MTNRESRRSFFALAGAGAVAVGCGKESSNAAAKSPQSENGAAHDEPDVSAVEDLMREHGVIRRVLVVYREAGWRLRAKPSSLPPDALQKAAQLLRTFAENYHEKLLEEAHIFPAVKRAGGPAANLVDTLIAQHNRGRDITDYVIALSPASIAKGGDPLARNLDGFARMYEEHAAFEDTIVFPAWKRTLSAKQLDEMGDLFEDIEHKTFGKDGFDDAVDRITEIEKEMGIELATFTPDPPPPIP